MTLTITYNDSIYYDNDVEFFIAGRDVSARFSSQDPDMPFNITWSRDGFQRLPEPEVSSRSEPAAAPARARRTSTRK